MSQDARARWVQVNANWVSLYPGYEPGLMGGAAGVGPAMDVWLTPPRATTIRNGRGEPPPTYRERALLQLLFDLRPGMGLNGGEIVARIPGLTQSDLTSRLVPELR